MSSRWRTSASVRVAITGNQWWTVAENWLGADTVFRAFRQYNRYLSENAANEFARLLGVPVLHASHCGHFEGRYLLAPGLGTSIRYVSEYVGRTQIVDAAGRTIAGRDAAEGPRVRRRPIHERSARDPRRWWLADDAGGTHLRPGRNGMATHQLRAADGSGVREVNAARVPHHR